MECEAVIVGTVAFDRILNQKFSPPAVQLHPSMMNCRSMQSCISIMGASPLGYIAIC
jgi:hypothetical protein